MSYDAENTLIALANPINWIWSDDTGNRGGWYGKSEVAQYQLIPPVAALDDINVSPADSSWRLVLYLLEDAKDHGAWVSTAEQGKAVCVRHAVSGDLSEADTLSAEMVTQMQRFLQQKDAGSGNNMG